jgi:hypothetical protein
MTGTVGASSLPAPTPTTTSGCITNSIGPNNDSGATEAGEAQNGPANLQQPGDLDLEQLVDNEETSDAAVLVFDIWNYGRSRL